jgi:hypothetical protein
MKLLEEYRQDRLDNFRSQLVNAGIKGVIGGSLVALVSGYYLSYKHNFGHNRNFFNTPYKIGYFVCWNIVGIIFCTDNAKLRLRKEAIVEDELRREEYIQNEQSR